ncbi:DUF3566 domain-containing protein [Gordonia terrae]|uniref:DUF3566 domain-containing protein n=2 Tax=Gordonia terrae TaxID=2055 RepID=A0AAD0KGX8_9ACTN|nr:DUF3566 domain-containing protein [Gordonia terrae]ANY25681.1 hypothetical protein BCM27_00035 [Gordonia terrae]AWO86426.1 hypothetical protein DLJ61_00035 [Gordonia terrae]GAB44106.1 hypothetical protein GOTRE_060_00130 [Gordonia terrae NBRC 100016]
MSTPNEPHQDQNGRPAGGPGGPGTGTPTGGLVPPWQRGPAEDSAAAPTETFTREGASRPGADGNPGGPPQSNPGGPPPRGVVTNSGTAAASMSGQQAPVTKLESPRRPGAATATEEPGFVESPTSTIDRGHLPENDLPDLDQIHHTADLKRPEAPQTPPGGKSVPRSAPRQVLAAGTALRASVQVRRIDPWATFKVAAVLSVVGFFIWMISVAVLYLILDGMGVWDQVNNSFGTLMAEESSTSGDVIGAGTVFGGAALLGAINAILLTALATIGSYIYNICADLVGGAEVTLADLD